METNVPKISNNKILNKHCRAKQFTNNLNQTVIWFYSNKNPEK